MPTVLVTQNQLRYASFDYYYSRTATAAHHTHTTIKSSPSTDIIVTTKSRSHVAEETEGAFSPDDSRGNSDMTTTLDHGEKNFVYLMDAKKMPIV